MTEPENETPLHVFRGTKAPAPNLRNTCSTLHKTIHNLAVELNYRDDGAHNESVARQIATLSLALTQLESLRRSASNG